MAISLNSHETRITELEKMIEVHSFIPDVDEFKDQNVHEQIHNYYITFGGKFCIIICYNFGISSSIPEYKGPYTWRFPVKFNTNPVVFGWDCNVDGNTPNKVDNTNISLIYQDWASLTSTKFSFTRPVGNFQMLAMGLLKLYYNFSYNKLVRFLSHLNTKFGGERR